MATTQSSIDPTLAPYLTSGLEEAKRLFLTGTQPSYYPGQTYVSPSGQTQEALAQQEALARQQSPLLQQAQNAFMTGMTAQNQASPLFQQLYGASATQPGANVYGQAAGGGFQNAATGMAQNLYGQAGAQPGASTYQQAAQGQLGNITTRQLSDIAGGSMLNSNPYQQQMMQAATRPLTQQFGEQVLPGISSLYSKSGRLGSGSMERALGTATEGYGRALGDVTANLAGNQYQSERALQQSALGQLSGVSAQDIQTMMAGAGGLQSAQAQALAQQSGLIGQIGGLSQQDFTNRLAGAQGLQQSQQATIGNQMAAAGQIGALQSSDLQRQMQGAQAAPSIYSQQYLPSQQLAQIGSAQEAISGQPLQEAMSRYNFQQQLPYQQLSGYLSSVYGSPMGSYGTQTQPTYNNTATNAITGALAGGLGGYALGQAFPGTFGKDSMFGSYGSSLAGAGAGGLLGGFL